MTSFSTDMFIAAVERHGIELKRDGGEFYARGFACPECGAEGLKAGDELDRVRLFPVNERKAGYKRGRWFCHHCQAHGDGVDFLMRVFGMSLPDARFAVTGEYPPDRPMSRKAKMQRGCRGVPQPPRPEAAVLPPAREAREWNIRPNPWPAPAWQAKATVLCCELDHRWNDFGAERMAEATRWIEEGRGINLAVAPVLGIYWNPRDRYEDPAVWGLKREKKLFIPKGIVIALHRRIYPPWEASPYIVGLLVRRANPSSAADKLRWVPFRDDDAGQDMPKTRTMLLGMTKARGCPCILVESALDAALVFQECGAEAAVIATCGATYPCDSDAAEMLEGASRLWAWPDADDAGMDAFRRWKKAFPSLRLIRPVDGEGRPWAKDATGLVAERRRRPECPTVREVLAGAGVVAHV